MDNWTFGFTMIVVGMGGTIAALGVLALLMGLLKKLFPVPDGPDGSAPAGTVDPGAGTPGPGKDEAAT